VGHLDFNGDTMVFTGDADGSAKVFLTLVDFYFQQRLKNEYNKGIERAAVLVESASNCDEYLTFEDLAESIRMEMLNG
jgi:hypothetical protein